MKTSTGISIEQDLMDFLRRIAEEDRRTVSDTVALWVEREATTRGWLKPPGGEPAKRRKGGELPAHA